MDEFLEKNYFAPKNLVLAALCMPEADWLFRTDNNVSVNSETKRAIGELPKLCVKIRPDS